MARVGQDEAGLKAGDRDMAIWTQEKEADRDAPGERVAGALAVPRHVAVIMDGNGRWAKERGLPRRAGHRAGADSVGAVVEVCQEVGVEYLTVYAFSSENWKRPKDEVAGLMQLLERFLVEKVDEMVERGVRLRAIGRLGRLPQRCRERLERAIEVTSDKRDLTLVMALSYGAREEITDAARGLAEAVVRGEMRLEDIDEEAFGGHLYTAGMPDPDLLIRTSGEMRLSNFLLWQASYAELYVTDVRWPDFRKEQMRDALEAYGRRRRRFGGL